jgi:hypothetical protein
MCIRFAGHEDHRVLVTLVLGWQDGRAMTALRGY